MRKVFATIIATAALTVPAMAAEFFIVREGPSGPCRIVEVRPTDSKIVIVGNKVYKERSEADRELAVVCK